MPVPPSARFSLASASCPARARAAGGLPQLGEAGLEGGLVLAGGPLGVASTPFRGGGGAGAEANWQVLPAGEGAGGDPVAGAGE